MNYLNLVEKRKSIRDFKEKTISQDQRNEIHEYFGSCRRLLEGIKVELIGCDSSVREKLEGFAGYQGYIIGAPCYLILLSEEKDSYLENAGYICEDLVLKLTDMGLDSCFITYGNGDAIKAALDISSPLKTAAIIAYGYGKPEKDLRRLNIVSPSDVKVTKREGHIAPKICVDEMVYYEEWGQRAELDDTLIDDGLAKALYAASLAPSFLNRQPYRFVLDSGKVILVRIPDSMTDDHDAKINCGTVMLNFTAALSQWRPADPQWIMGKPAKSYQLPNGYEIISYCEV